MAGICSERARMPVCEVFSAFGRGKGHDLGDFESNGIRGAQIIGHQHNPPPMGLDVGFGGFGNRFLQTLLDTLDNNPDILDAVTDIDILDGAEGLLDKVHGLFQSPFGADAHFVHKLEGTPEQLGIVAYHQMRVDNRRMLDQFLRNLGPGSFQLGLFLGKGFPQALLLVFNQIGSHGLPGNGTKNASGS